MSTIQKEIKSWEDFKEFLLEELRGSKTGISLRSLVGSFYPNWEKEGLFEHVEGNFFRSNLNGIALSLDKLVREDKVKMLYPKLEAEYDTRKDGRPRIVVFDALFIAADEEKGG